MAVRDTWVLAGQSNMQGAAPLGIPAAPPDPRVHSFSMAGQWEVAQEPLHKLWESFTPVHQLLMREGMPESDLFLSDEEHAQREEATRLTGAGLGYWFGRAIAESTGGLVGLIPSAHGGSTLDQWSPLRKDEGASSLYGAMLERIRRAEESDDIALRGVLWYQGESDAFSAESETYLQRMSDWIVGLRLDLGWDIPIHVVQLGRFVRKGDDILPGQTPEAWDRMRDALRRIPDTVVGTSMVSAIDLPLADPIHVDADGLRRLGARLARAALGRPVPRVVGVRRMPDSVLGYPVVRLVCDGMEHDWRPSAHMTGFAVRDSGGSPHPRASVIEARPSPDGRSIDVMLDVYADDVMLGYGLGFDPPATVVNAADCALPAFLPFAVS